MKKVMPLAAVMTAAMMGSTALNAAEVEVIHWWTSGGEQAAVSVFADEFDALGEHKWVDNAVALGETARATIMQRALGGDPPDAAQFNPGRQYEDLIAAGLLLDLTPVAEAEGWDDFIRPDETKAPCKIDGKWWCVPVNIHMINWAWASIPAFEKAGLEVPTTWDEYLEALPALEEAGVIPFAIGGDGGGWQVSLAANQIILARLGAEAVEKIWKDKDLELAGGPEVLETFETLKMLGSYADDGSPNRSWADTASLVIQDEAALQIMGDWAQGEFQLAGEVPGEDYACLLGPLVPEPEHVRMGGDIFVFFKQNDPEVEQAQLALASVMVNPRTQALFNTAKGSAPIRDDVDLSLANDCMKEAIEVLSKPGAVVPDTNQWRDEAFTTAQNAIFSDLIYNDATTPEAAQQQFVDLLRNSN
ncbi:MAG TPA: ABC transporter substrate-binding protein [Devosiaceae bacterium]|jgi:glucose/mannose transport system substrate-binding protein|nr:ABC transporter substrate-binding protein [Devosiaceae bacterium]